MTRDYDDDVRAEEAPFETRLCERLGGAVPPDLTARVRQRLARGDSVAAAGRLARAEAGAAAKGPRVLVAAALVLLGLGVVATTWWLAGQRPAAGDGRHAAQRVAQPQPVEPTAPVAPPPGGQDPQGRPIRGDLEFRLQVADRYGGRVQAFELEVLKVTSKAPLVAARMSGHPRRTLHPRGFTDDFTTIGGLPPGNYLVTVLADAHAMTVSAPFTLVEGEPVPQVSVRLNLGGELRGRVVDDDGEPVAAVEVRARLLGEAGERAVATSWAAVSDEQGVFRLPLRLPPGSFMVYASERDLDHPFVRLQQMKATDRSFEVDAGVREVELDLRLPRR